jgi:hypothetical protein
LEKSAFKILAFNNYTFLSVFLQLFEKFLEVTTHDVQRNLQNHLILSMAALQPFFHQGKDTEIT